VIAGRIHEPALVIGYPVEATEHRAPLVLERVVGREHDEAKRRAMRDAAVEREGQAQPVDQQAGAFR